MLSPHRPLLSNTAHFSNILNISFDGLVLVAVSVLGTGAPHFSSIHSPYHFWSVCCTISVHHCNVQPYCTASSPHSLKLLTSQRKLRWMASGYTSNANRFLASKLKQTPHFSVCYQHHSHSVFFPHTPASQELIGCPSIHRRPFSRMLKETTEVAQAELVNCILHACGCNDSVNQDEAVDYDGIINALDNFKEALNRCHRLCSPPSSQDDSHLCIPHSHSVQALTWTQPPISACIPTLSLAGWLIAQCHHHAGGHSRLFWHHLVYFTLYVSFLSLPLLQVYSFLL